ncbi:MAG: carboxypeptidase regulatory-like domain-containing protein [Candidatus Methanomethyliaceae archaeon]|nr:carboxypeptidase regulatory-like domain-containing protein [Candidatus Methanomethyliaceae archaeon]
MKAKIFLPFFLLMLLVVPVIAQTLTVTTNVDVYAPGETIIVTGSALPNTDVTIQLFNPNNELVDITYVRSGADGKYATSFRLPSVMPMDKWILGTYTVKAFMAGQSATKTITVQLRIAVIGKVVDSTGAGVPDATVTIGTVSATTGADGSFTVALTAEGRYVMKVTKTGYYTYTANVTAAIGTTNVGTITLTSLEDVIASLQKQVSDLTKQVSDLNSLVIRLNSSLAAATSEIATLKDQVRTLQGIATTVSDLQRAASSLDASVKTLQTTVTSLQAAIAQLPAFYALAFIGIVIAIIAIILVYRKIAK